MLHLRYSRNRIFITKEEQQAIKDFPILLAGCGIGSVIAECALRFGFENLTIIDGDQVELSNLNRQNYIESDIASMKVEAIRKRLLSINQDANINVCDNYLTTDNVVELVAGHKVAVNALDFDSPIPLKFDNVCQDLNIHVLHPFNLGWGGALSVIDPHGPTMDILADDGDEPFNELNVVNYMSSFMRFWGEPQEWLEEVVENYHAEVENLSPPQLSIGSWTVAAMCTNVMFRLCTNKDIKQFPEFYFSTILED